ncbi:MAG: hypothetical protein ACAH83_09275 [Alphaproteobacteria bacterium]
MFSFESLANMFNDRAEDDGDDDNNAFPFSGVGHGWPLAEDMPTSEMAKGYAAFFAPKPAPVPAPIVLEALAERMTIGRPLQLLKNRRAAFSA